MIISNAQKPFTNSDKIRQLKKVLYVILAASVVDGLKSMTSYPVTSLAKVRSPGDALVV
jgi:hypothetical protein